MNSIVLSGRLVKDIEVKVTNSGTKVCQFTLAVNRNRKNEVGEYQTDFIDCVAWRQSAEFLGNYSHKGDFVEVNGTLQTRTYDRQDGTKAKVVEVNCNDVAIPVKENREKKEEPQVEPHNSFTIESFTQDDLPF